MPSIFTNITHSIRGRTLYSSFLLMYLDDELKAAIRMFTHKICGRTKKTNEVTILNQML
jgi:hypothetical protein